MTLTNRWIENNRAAHCLERSILAVHSHLQLGTDKWLSSVAEQQFLSFFLFSFGLQLSFGYYSFGQFQQTSVIFKNIDKHSIINQLKIGLCFLSLRANYFLTFHLISYSSTINQKDYLVEPSTYLSYNQWIIRRSSSWFAAACEKMLIGHLCSSNLTWVTLD